MSNCTMAAIHTSGLDHHMHEAHDSMMRMTMHVARPCDAHHHGGYGVLLYFALPWAVSRPPPYTRLHDTFYFILHRHGSLHHRRDPRDTCCACHIWRLEPFHALQMSCIADFMSRALPRTSDVLHRRGAPVTRGRLRRRPLPPGARPSRLPCINCHTTVAPIHIIRTWQPPFTWDT